MRVKDAVCDKLCVKDGVERWCVCDKVVWKMVRDKEEAVEEEPGYRI